MINTKYLDKKERKSKQAQILHVLPLLDNATHHEWQNIYALRWHSTPLSDAVCKKVNLEACNSGTG